MHGRSRSYDTLKREQRRDAKSGYENDGFMVEQAADDDEEDYDEEEAEGDEENDEESRMANLRMTPLRVKRTMKKHLRTGMRLRKSQTTDAADG